MLEIIIAGIVCLILIALWVSGIKSKERDISALQKRNVQLIDVIKDAERNYGLLHKRHKDEVGAGRSLRNAIADNNSKISALKNELSSRDRVISNLQNTNSQLNGKFESIEKDLPNNLIATNDGEVVTFYKIMEVDADDNFKGKKVGDNVACIRRKVEKHIANVPVVLKFKR